MENDWAFKPVVGIHKVLVTQSCPIPCDPMNCSPPGSSVHGILQSRILEWVAISFFRVYIKYYGEKSNTV